MKLHFITALSFGTKYFVFCDNACLKFGILIFLNV